MVLVWISNTSAKLAGVQPRASRASPQPATEAGLNADLDQVLITVRHNLALQHDDGHQRRALRTAHHERDVVRRALAEESAHTLPSWPLWAILARHGARKATTHPQRVLPLACSAFGQPGRYGCAG
jgi:hypothetical protein